eukprot:226797_1
MADNSNTNENQTQQEQSTLSIEKAPQKEETDTKQAKDNNDPTESKDASHTDNDIKEDNTNPDIDEQTLSMYFNISSERRTRFQLILSKMDELQFKLSKSTNLQFIINNNDKFTIKTSITQSKAFKNEPTVWYLETIMPGTPEMFLKYWGESECRLKWDTKISSHKTIHVHKNEQSMLYIVNTQTLPAVGGLISPRNFTELLRCWKINEENVIGLEKASKSIKYKDYPSKKGFVDAHNTLTGQRITLINDKQLKEMYDIPPIKMKSDNENEILKWCRVQAVLQTDLKGWLPTSVVELGISDGLIASYALCRLYMLKSVFGLDVNVSKI